MIVQFLTEFVPKLERIPGIVARILGKYFRVEQTLLIIAAMERGLLRSNSAPANSNISAFSRDDSALTSFSIEAKDFISSFIPRSSIRITTGNSAFSVS